MIRRLKYITALSFVIALIFFYSFDKKISDETIDVVRIEPGLISGIRNENSNVIFFKGIPFAAPPVGDMRWKAPAPTSSWKGVRKCDAFGASPMQPKPIPFFMLSKEFLIPEQRMSEDCL